MTGGATVAIAVLLNVIEFQAGNQMNDLASKTNTVARLLLLPA